MTEAVAPYSPFAPLSHPGTFPLVGALVGLAMLAVGGLTPPAVRFTAADPDAL